MSYYSFYRSPRFENCPKELVVSLGDDEKDDNGISGTYTVAPYPGFVNGQVYWIQNNENNNAIWYRNDYVIIGPKKEVGGYPFEGFIYSEVDFHDSNPSWPNEAKTWIYCSNGKKVNLNIHVPG